jgi:hypothetical protein
VRVIVATNQARIEWNDQGEPVSFTAGSLNYTLNDEKDLVALYECLDFLFGTTKARQ